MTPVDDAQQQRFLREIVPAARAVCAQYGCDPKQCIEQAAQGSDCGKTAMAYNYWGLQGTGDSGYYLSIQPVRTYKTAGGGWSAQGAQMAKFSSPFAAVAAWCKAQKG